MGLVDARVELKHTSGMPEDVFVNTFKFRWDGPTAPSAGELAELADLLEEFYNVDTPTGTIVAQLLSYEISRAASATSIKIYTADDLGDLLGSPSYTRQFTLGAAAGGYQSLPAEVAVVASLYADMTDIPQESGATRPAARRRGRSYMGPFTTNVLAAAADATTVQRPDAETIATLLDAFERLGNASQDIMSLNAGLFMSVYSPSDQALRTVKTIHVDNAFDTVRKRGPDASARTARTVDFQ